MMTTPVNVQEMFASLDGSIGTHLKSQRSALLLCKPADYQRAFDFLVKSAVIGSFDIQVVKALAKRMKDVVKAEKDFEGKPLKALATAEHFTESWRIFNEMTSGAYSKADGTKVLSIDEAAGFILKGAVSLCTHSDKSSELPQSHASSAGFINDLSDALGIPGIPKASDDASVLVRAPFGESLPVGVTMSSAEQAELGIVCSSSRSVIAAVGNAAYSPYQQFFMMPFMEEGAPATNMLEVLLTPRRDILGKMLGLDAEPSTSDMEAWLMEPQGARTFAATLFFGMSFLAKGEFRGQVDTIERIAGPINLTPATYFNEPFGRGINHIQLPVDGGYVHATPLVNLSLIRDINALAFQQHEGDDQRAWRELFTTVHIGGSKPQNAGSFWSSVKGDVNALRSYLSTRTGGISLLQKNLREGKTVIFVRQDQVYSICPRQQVPGNPDWVNQKLLPGSQKVLEDRTKCFVDSLVKYLGIVCELIETGLISLMTMSTHCKGDALAERAILTGTASKDDISTYAAYLARQIFNKTIMTKAEKQAVDDCLRKALPRALEKEV